MTASRASSQTLEVGELIDSELIELDRLAAREEWAATEALLKRLPRLLLQVPLADRHPILQRVREQVENLRDQVQHRTETLGGQLAGLKTGQRAAASYLATSALDGDTAG